MHILVTGGSGFIGSGIVRALINQGHKVRTLNRNKVLKSSDIRIEYILGDIRNKSVVEEAVKGVDVVFHVAAKIGYWGNLSLYQDINVGGTLNLLRAAKSNGVKKFIYTSTPSVVGYFKDVENGQQNIPYPTTYLSPYSKTKSEAEQAVLTFNQKDMATISLRPHLVFGPGDTNLLPKIIDRAIANKLPIIGEKKIMVDFTYIDNAVNAHICALEALGNHNSRCAGKAYFISNDEPIDFWLWLNTILDSLGHTKINKKIKRSIAYKYATVLELIWKVLPIKDEPPLTRFVVNALSRHHYYSMKPAFEDLRYVPQVSMREATNMTIAWLNKRKKINY